MIPLPDGPATVQSRVALLLASVQSAEVRAEIRARAEFDPVWFIDYFGVVEEPRAYGEEAVQPFLLFPFQRETVARLYRHIQEGKDLLIEKSRDVGATWMVLWLLLHQWLFRSHFQALIGSYRQEETDNFTTRSLFGKLEFALRHLPGWLLPEGFEFRKHRVKNRILNPENGSTLQGAPSSSEFGRGGRFACIFLDEAAMWEELPEVWAATSQASPCRILVSTPKGRNYFAELRFSGQIEVVTLHWSLRPDRDEAWYEQEKARLVDPGLVAQELDISYDRSITGLVYPGWYHVPKGHYPAQEDWPTFVAIDFGIADPTAMVWAQKNPKTGKYRIVDYYEAKGKPADFFIPFVTGELPEDTSDYTPEDLEKIALHATWPRPIVFGDPAGAQRSQATGKSVFDIWREAGVPIVSRAEAQRFEVRYQLTQLFLREIEGVNLPACEKLDLAISQARFPERRSDTRSTARLDRPIHNWTSHGRSALEYLAANLLRPGGRGKVSFRPRKRSMIYDALF